MRDGASATGVCGDAPTTRLLKLNWYNPTANKRAGSCGTMAMWPKYQNLLSSLGRGRFGEPLLLRAYGASVVRLGREHR
jgi:hypothetical protein